MPIFRRGSSFVPPPGTNSAVSYYGTLFTPTINSSPGLPGGLPQFPVNPFSKANTNAYNEFLRASGAGGGAGPQIAKSLLGAIPVIGSILSIIDAAKGNVPLQDYQKHLINQAKQAFPKAFPDTRKLLENTKTAQKQLINRLVESGIHPSLQNFLENSLVPGRNFPMAAMVQSAKGNIDFLKKPTSWAYMLNSHPGLADNTDTGFNYIFDKNGKPIELLQLGGQYLAFRNPKNFYDKTEGDFGTKGGFQYFKDNTGKYKPITSLQDIGYEFSGFDDPLYNKSPQEAFFKGLEPAHARMFNNQQQAPTAPSYKEDPMYDIFKSYGMGQAANKFGPDLAESAYNRAFLAYKTGVPLSFYSRKSRPMGTSVNTPNFADSLKPTTPTVEPPEPNKFRGTSNYANQLFARGLM